MYGQGLNSLRIRFTLMVAVPTGMMVVLAAIFANVHVNGLVSDILWVGLLAAFAAAVSLLTYVMTGKLTKPIENLRASTEAIARGEFDAPVNVDCNCEVGGLADSFRLMVKRLNSNVSRINTLAFEDGITGLPNRAVLNDVLAKMSDARGALMFIDLDNFKQVNDTLGHEKGDLLLLKAADRIVAEGLEMSLTTLDECLTPFGDKEPGLDDCRMLFRWAGDEFIALFSGMTDRQQVATIAERVISTLEQVFELEENNVRISASIGIAMLGEDTSDPAEIIKFADLAMYAAKNSGKGRFAFFDADMRLKAIERAQLEAELDAAIDSGQLRVHYQPKVATANLGFESVEALVRWQHPERGLLFPAEFMAIAEACGMVDRIGREVVRIAAVDLKNWIARGIERRIAINICPTQFLDEAFSATVLTYLAGMDIPARLVEIELTENIAMSDPQRAAVHLRVLKDAGIRIAIDDFGVGYSNLSQLYSLPFDILKIDRSLIIDIATDSNAQTIVAATINMAHGLGHGVVAEGVETERQFEILRLLGCDYIQGYLFARPMEAVALDAWAEQGQWRKAIAA